MTEAPGETSAGETCTTSSLGLSVWGSRLVEGASMATDSSPPGRAKYTPTKTNDTTHIEARRRRRFATRSAIEPLRAPCCDELAVDLGMYAGSGEACSSHAGVLALRLISSTRCGSGRTVCPAYRAPTRAHAENRSMGGYRTQSPKSRVTRKSPEGGLPREAAVVHDRDRGERLW